MPRIIMGVKTYSLVEVSEMVGLSTRTLIKYLQAGKLIGGKIGRRWVFSEDQVKQFLKENSVATAITRKKTDE